MIHSVVGFGAGGNAKVVIEILRQSSIYHLHGFLDPDRSLWGVNVLGVVVLGDDTLVPELISEGVGSFFIGIGAVSSLEPRRRLYDLACSYGLRAVNAIHPTAVLSESATFGSGFTAMANSVVNAQATLGKNVVINTGAIVEHDCIVGNHVHISPRATLLGAVKVGDGTMIGAGAVIRQGVKVGSNSIIGAGAVVVKDVQDGEVVVGIPARPLNKGISRIQS